MYYYPIILLIAALLAGVLGFGALAGTAATVAKIVFGVLIVLLLVAMIGGNKRSI